MTEPPDGYLGATARIRSGPAPELVEAGYELELADAPLLQRGLGLADLAHVLALDAIPDADRRALLAALLELLDGELGEVDSRYGDLVNVRERVLEQRIGTAAGWLNAGRPRREAGRIAFRIALRERLLDLAAAVVRFAAGLVAVADRERTTLMPDYTYLQAAQPTTAGHWLLSFAYPALRDAERLRGDLAWVNRSPGGAGGINGSRFQLDRERIARLLGFDRPITHTRDAMWQTDGLAELVAHAAIAATDASRFAEDVEVYATDEFGLMEIGDALCRASALMPQKRNPYALAVLRGGAGTLIGRATGVLATQRTPSGRTDNLLYAYGEVAGSVTLAARLMRLAAAVAETLTIDAERAAAAVREGFAMATDAAEALSAARGIDYRSAYKIVGEAVAGGSLDAAALGLDPSDLDPVAALATRTVTGGAAPAPLDAMFDQCRRAISGTEGWIAERRSAIAAAEADLVALARMP
jgi:argininosuccinate lyase